MASRSLIRSTPSSNGGSRLQPMSLFGSLHREIDRLFDDVSRDDFGMLQSPAQANLLPSIDVAETDQEIEITAELPGLDRENIDISIEDDLLTIRGGKKVETKQDDQNKNHRVSERSYGLFYRVIQLPPGVDASSSQAFISNGVLKLMIPKLAKAEPKKIEVKEAA